MENKNVITDEEVENYINTATREYDEERKINQKPFELKDLDGNILQTIEFLEEEDLGTIREYKIAKLSDYPNLTEKELGYFGLKDVKDYDDLKEQVRNILYEARKDNRFTYQKWRFRRSHY